MREDTFTITDGRNVVLHGFAHQLDGESGAFDGVPVLEKKTQVPTWSADFTKAFRSLQNPHHTATAIDSYGATNPAEFFAVATECFFERPAAMHYQYPSVFEDLKMFCQQDPLHTTDSVPSLRT